jgi:hypothetical protein
MSTMNPLKFAGGMILEIGAVIAVLAMLPAMGNREAAYSATPEVSDSPNQVFFDATSSRVVDSARSSSQQTKTWQSDLVPLPPIAQQRYVENTLDHNSQRALDAAARIWNQGDRLLPPELRVRREPDVVSPLERRAPTWSEPRPSYYAPAGSRLDGRY